MFPLVVHHGAQPWRAACELTSLFAAVPQALAAYRPSLRYFVLDEHRAARATGDDNVVGHLVALEGSTTPDAVRRSIMALQRCLGDARHDSLRRAFTVYIHRVVSRRLNHHTDVPHVNDLQELDAMLAERVDEWTKNGKQQGLEEGRLQGQRELLRTLLAARFPAPLPDAVVHRIDAADAAAIAQWTRIAATAQRWEDVFGGNGAP